MSKIREIVAQFKDVPGGVVEALHAVNSEYRHVPEGALVEVADELGVNLSQVYSVATFYSMFSVKNRGQNIIRICSSAPCQVNGAAEVLAALEKELGIKVGETTDDGKFTLETTECVGACQMTPVITINGVYYGDVEPGKVSEILNQYR